MASKMKHYTLAEKKIFLDILENYRDIIEAKKSDASTLREKAETWNEIARQYNESSQIDAERTLAQLKKLWTNLKHTQKNALTRESQAYMATGGGPQEPPAGIDPDIAMIAPHLMEAAPSIFPSNVPVEHRNDTIALMQRVAGLCDQDDQMFEIKKRHAVNVCKLKEAHLNVMHHMREEHLAKIQDLELRKATAETELAELRLLREKNN